MIPRANLLPNLSAIEPNSGCPNTGNLSISEKARPDRKLVIPLTRCKYSGVKLTIPKENIPFMNDAMVRARIEFSMALNGTVVSLLFLLALISFASSGSFSEAPKLIFFRIETTRNPITKA